MAYTIKQQPTSPWGAYDLMVFRVYDDDVDTFAKYRYQAKVYFSTQLLATLRVLPNANGEGIFEVSQIVQDQMEADKPWNEEKLSAANMSGVLQVLFFRVTADNDDEQETESSQQAASNFIDVLAGAHTPETSASNITTAGRFIFGSGETRNIAISNYRSYNGSLPSSPPLYRQRIRQKEYGTVSIYKQDAMDELFILQYNVQWNAVGQTNLSVPIALTDVDAGDCVLHYGAGPQNLSEAGITLSTYAKYYGLFWASGGQLMSYWFEIEEDCKHPLTRLAFWNQYGGIDYFNMRGTARESRNVERRNYRTFGGNFYTASGNTDAVVNPDEGYKSAGKVQVEKSLQLHSGYLQEHEVEVVVDLLQSPRVWVYEQSSWQSVIIDQNSVEVKTSLIDKTIEYEFRVQFARYQNATG